MSNGKQKPARQDMSGWNMSWIVGSFVIVAFLILVFGSDMGIL